MCPESSYMDVIEDKMVQKEELRNFQAKLKMKQGRSKAWGGSFKRQVVRTSAPRLQIWFLAFVWFSSLFDRMNTWSALSSTKSWRQKAFNLGLFYLFASIFNLYSHPNAIRVRLVQIDHITPKMILISKPQDVELKEPSWKSIWLPWNPNLKRIDPNYMYLYYNFSFTDF